MQQAFFIVCSRDKMQTTLMQDFVKIVREKTHRAEKTGDAVLLAAPVL